MKLFLCGGGCGNQITEALQQFEKLLDKTKPVLYVPLAMEEKMYDSCSEWFSGECKNFGCEKFEMVRSSLELSEKNFDKYAAIFIGGGNTFKLLNEINQNGNREKIMNYLENGGVVFGGSAGAIIFGKDINTCLLDDGNEVGLECTTGLNLLNDYSILCHLNEKSLKDNMEHLNNLSNNDKVIYMPEENVIFLDNNSTCLIGKSGCVIFEKGEHFARRPEDFKNDIKK
ncbi:MAG: Type 1 glutamine amidotransferase-like domain-containing protein [Clostridia bacterium]|nr:Type 1 glutamine amidotransferase-like domain-containing protein [Clostridia bacterium]